LALVILLIAGCQQQAVPSAKPSPSELPVTPVRGGRLIEGTFADAKTFAPAATPRRRR
jgi:hypothetical protein